MGPSRDYDKSERWDRRAEKTVYFEGERGVSRGFEPRPCGKWWPWRRGRRGERRAATATAGASKFKATRQRNSQAAFVCQKRKVSRSPLS